MMHLYLNYAREHWTQEGGIGEKKARRTTESRDILQTASAKSGTRISATALRILNHGNLGQTDLLIRVNPCASVAQSFLNHGCTRMHTDKDKKPFEAPGLGVRWNKTKDKDAVAYRASLAKAFRGKLVPQNPADEPAEALLAQIRSQKTASAPALPTQHPEVNRP